MSKHRKQKHHNIHQGQLIFNPFPEELRQLREAMRADVREANRKKLIAHKATEAEAWEEIKRTCVGHHVPRQNIKLMSEN